MLLWINKNYEWFQDEFGNSALSDSFHCFWRLATWLRSLNIQFSTRVPIEELSWMNIIYLVWGRELIFAVRYFPQGLSNAIFNNLPLTFSYVVATPTSVAQVVANERINELLLFVPVKLPRANPLIFRGYLVLMYPSLMPLRIQIGHSVKSGSPWITLDLKAAAFILNFSYWLVRIERCKVALLSTIREFDEARRFSEQVVIFWILL